MPLGYLKCNGRGAWLRFVAAKCNPLLLKSLLVLQVVLHVREHHVTRGDVHVARGGLVRPGVQKVNKAPGSFAFYFDFWN